MEKTEIPTVNRIRECLEGPPRSEAQGSLLDEAMVRSRQRTTLLALAAEWVEKCNQLKREENERLVIPEEPDPSELKSHKRWIEVLQQAGSFLILNLREMGLELPDPYQTRNLEAVLARLKLDYHLWHESKKYTLEESEAFAKEMFG